MHKITFTLLCKRVTGAAEEIVRDGISAASPVVPPTRENGDPIQSKERDEPNGQY